MAVVKQQVVVFEGARIDVASGVIRSPTIFCEGLDAVRILIAVSEIGTPGSGQSITVRPAFCDERGNEYLDADTTYGTVTIAGSGATVKKSYVVPNPGSAVALVITGTSGLSSSTGFVVSARFDKIPKVPGG
jgi:hypothetical protein